MSKSSVFQFQRFTISQEHSAMKVGTDGVLLGALAQFEHPRRLLDIGCGTGLLALMLKQRYPDIVVHALEIDEAAAIDAATNFENSPWEIALTIGDFKEFAPQHPASFDAIVCNPPYFVDSLKPPTAQRTQARHTDSLPFGDLAQGIATTLTENGYCWVILPPVETTRFVGEANRFGLYAVKRIEIASAEGLQPKRIITCLSKTPNACVTTMLSMQSADRLTYTSEYRKSVEPFYLEKYFRQKQG